MSLSAITSHIAAAIHWLPPWGRALGVFSLIVAAGSLAQVAIVWFLGRCAKNWHPLARAMFLRVRPVIRFAVLFLALAVALPLVPLGAHGQDVGHKLLVALFIVLMGWIALVLADILIDNYVARFRVDVADNLLARKAVTQMRVLRRAVSVTIILVTAGFALMSFDAVRQFGFSLFASAGVAGIVAGLAARPLLSNLIAGIQLAMTQPIRIEDAVVIDKEWGWVRSPTFSTMSTPTGRVPDPTSSAASICISTTRLPLRHCAPKLNASCAPQNCGTDKWSISRSAMPRNTR